MMVKFKNIVKSVTALKADKYFRVYSKKSAPRVVYYKFSGRVMILRGLILLACLMTGSSLTYAQYGAGEDLCKNLYEIEERQLSPVDKEIKRGMIKFLGAGISDEQFFFAMENKSHLMSLYLAKRNADYWSREFCNIPEDAKRNLDDEVDAIRHFIWSALMVGYTRSEHVARTVTCLQELRSYRRTGRMTKSTDMDFENNELAFEYARLDLDQSNWPRQRHGNPFSKRRMREEVFKRLNEGQFTVLKSGKGFCSRPNLYPNR